LDEVIADLKSNGILRTCPHIVYAFRMFLIAKANGAARPILDLSPWTPLYRPPPIRLFSAADILTTITPASSLINIDLASGFFQFHVRQQYWKCYGVYYRQEPLAWTRVPIGHPLAPSIMQRVATAVARMVTQQFQVNMVAYLDDWFFFKEGTIPVPQLLQYLQQLGFTINYRKSVLQPTTSLVYLGLNIDTIRGYITRTRPCILHLQDLVSVIPNATQQDLLRIN
jgi:hypothetical protein